MVDVEVARLEEGENMLRYHDYLSLLEIVETTQCKSFCQCMLKQYLAEGLISHSMDEWEHWMLARGTKIKMY